MAGGEGRLNTWPIPASRSLALFVPQVGVGIWPFSTTRAIHTNLVRWRLGVAAPGVNLLGAALLAAVDLLTLRPPHPAQVSR